MMQKIRNTKGTIGDNKGFTLVEMALVLIIIGIIIGAVVKGKDLVRGAEQKRIYSKYLNEWRLAYLNFYDRTGKILGDTWDLNAQPAAAAGQDGQADTAEGTNAAAPTDNGRYDLNDGPAAGTAYMGLSQVGLNAPVTNISGIPWQYKYVDSGGNAHFLDIAFEWSGTYNYMMINNIPYELAIAIDTMVDGEANGQAGDFLNGDGTSAWATTPTVEVDDVRWRMNF
jgi:prepilin-type N-terminal cleavage/methylation domain-containing protein